MMHYRTYVLEAMLRADPTDSEKRESYNRELSAWHEMDAMIEVPRSSLPSEANLIGSHVVYRRKPDGTLKARIVPWGHRDVDKSYLRTDAPCMNVEVFRLVISLAVGRKWDLCEMDVKAAFLQADGFKRDI